VVLSERTRNHASSAAFIYACGRYVRRFKEHRRYQMARFQQIQVDVLMVGNLASLFCFLLLGALVTEPTTAIIWKKKEKQLLVGNTNEPCL
jgi:hypothetical protein